MKRRNVHFLAFTLSILFLWYLEVAAQSVGIGTNNPNSKAILELSATDRVFLPPRLTTPQMNAISSPPVGSIVYNTDLQQYMGYVRSHITRVTIGGNTIVSNNNRWLPISTGPRILAWGIVDSNGNKVNGSDNYSIVWDGYNAPVPSTNNWYALTLTGTGYYKDSMMLLITAIGNGSWDQAISTGELIEGTTRRATIKFTDVSRIANDWTLESSRRRSWFSFTLYDLRTEPF